MGGERTLRGDVEGTANATNPHEARTHSLRKTT